MTTRQEKQQTDGAAAQDEISREAAFRRARNHSRKVSFLKIALPVAAILIAGSFAAYSYLSVPGSFSFNVADSAYANGKLVMANPKLDGYTKENLPFSMTALRALQQIGKKSGIVELEGIDAKLPVGKDVVAMIGADHGVYNRDKNTLDIRTPITVKTSDGLTVLLQSAYVDIGSGNMKTKDPVNIDMDGAKLAANAMRVLENGKVLIFEKRVKMELKPDRLKGREGPSKEGVAKDVVQD